MGACYFTHTPGVISTADHIGFEGVDQQCFGDMILQGLVHSIHHRAQAVNMLRQLGLGPPEVDYMTSVRLPEP